MEIRLARETSWDVARVRRKVVRLNRDLVVPLETVVMVANLRKLGRSEEPLERTTTSRVCSRGRTGNFLKELFGRQLRAVSCACRRACCGMVGSSGDVRWERLAACGRREDLEEL